MHQYRKMLFLIGGMVVLGILSWIIGWMSHAFSSAMRQDNAELLQPSVFPGDSLPIALCTPSIYPTLTDSLVMREPTSTPASTFTPFCVPTWEIVRPGDAGLYDVCRRHCPGKWLDGSIPFDLESYARQIAEHNRLPWGKNGPILQSGQRIEMLACPW